MRSIFHSVNLRSDLIIRTCRIGEKIHKLNILFVISKSRKRKDGKAPLFCRLTFQEKRKQFATGLFVNPDYWDNRKQEAKPPDKESKFINSQLSLVQPPFQCTVPIPATSYPPSASAFAVKAGVRVKAIRCCM